MRARSSKLLSGASIVAVIATFGAVSPASANQTFTGPLLTDPIINGDNGSTAINTGAKVLADGNNDSFFNGIGMVDITVDASFLSGRIHNTAAGSITTGVGVVVQNASQIDGGIWNEGTIGGSTSGVAIDTGSVVDVGILNDGTISGATNGVLLGLNSAINGGVTNNGVITGAIGFNMSGATSELRGGIANASGASIVGTTTAAISVSGLGAQLKGGITNDGLIQGQNSANAIQLTNGTITGGITNHATGTIQATGVSVTAILVNGATFTGDITNTGQILATNTSSLGVVLTGTTVFTGNVTNNHGGLISADLTAVAVNNTTFTGTITNDGQITSANGDGIHAAGTTFAGNIVNAANGVISSYRDGIEASATTFTGDIVNDGNITSLNSTGIFVSTAAFTGNITNSGSITASNAAGINVQLGAVVNGTITNQSGGVITANTAGIAVSGQVTGGIVNAGVITGKTAGIDLSGATTLGHTITQTAGLIQGNNGGTITTALNLVNTQADTFNGDGGTVDGNVSGDAAGSDNFVMHASGTFSYLRGTVTGINQFDMQGTGTAVLGAQSRGATGAGATINAVSMTHSSGTVYLDDNTTVNLTNYTQSAGTLEFQLTSNTAAHGLIAATGGAALGGNIAAYIQGNTFATTGGNTFTYQNVITGPIAGTFANAGAIDTNSLFFTGVAQVNATDVDIVLTRQSFANALALPNLSANQQAIGGTLDTIYNAGGYSPQFTNLFNYILSQPAGSQAEVTRVYDELAGAEHAGVEAVGLRVSQGFTDQIGDRLADLRGASSMSMAELGMRRYADATPTNTANDMPQRPGGMRGSMSMWGRGYGSWTDQDGDAEARSYNQDSGGFAGGVDFAVDANWNVGGALGWSTTDITYATRGDNANLDAFQFAGYGNYSSGDFYLDAAIALGFQDVNTTRLLELGTAGPAVATANYNANSFGVRGEAGWTIDAGRIDLEPFLTLAYATTSTDGFSESGAGPFDLLVSSADASSLTTTLGARFSGAWQAGGVRLVPNATIAWRHEFLDDNQDFSAAFLEDTATQFRIVSAEQARDSVIARAGIGVQVSKNLTLFLDYNGIYSSTTTTHGASGGLRATW